MRTGAVPPLALAGVPPSGAMMRSPLPGVPRAAVVPEAAGLAGLRRAVNPAHHHRRAYEIAFALGFSSEAHFSRVFRSTFGLSPSDVRGRTQATRVDASRPEPADIANGGYEERVRQLK
jgi:hypothetical protein